MIKTAPVDRAIAAPKNRKPEAAQECKHRWRLSDLSVRERTYTQACSCCGKKQVKGW